MKNKTSKIDEFVSKLEEKIRADERKTYTKRTLEEAYNPKNVGKIKNADGFGKVTGPCGDTIWMYLKVKDNGIIDDKFLTDGCGASVACGSVITELVKNKSIEDAYKIEIDDILSVLGGLPEEYQHCAVLAVTTLRAAIRHYKLKAKGITEDLR